MTERQSQKLSFLSLVAAIMVVLSHLETTSVFGFQKMVQQLIFEICLIAVPFFFSVSGYMIARHTNEASWYGEAIRKRIRTLAVPYIVWCLIFYFISITLTVLANYQAGRSCLSNFPSGFVALGLNPFHPPASISYWYLRELIILVLISWPISRLMRISRAVSLSWLVVLYVLAVLSPFGTGLDEFFTYFMSCRAVFYYSLGFYIFYYHNYSIGKKTAIACFVIGLLGMLMLSFLGGFNLRIDSHLFNFVRFTGIFLFLIGLWRVVPSVALPRAFANLAFPLYCVQAVVMPVAYLVFKNMISTSVRTGVVGCAIIALVIISISMTGSILLLTFMPRFATIAFGGRGNKR